MEYDNSNDPEQIETSAFDGLLDNSVNNIQALARKVDQLQTALDAIYAPMAKGVTNGDSHDHNGGDGAQIDHVNLANKGTNTHAQLDTHLAAAAPHSGHSLTTHTHTLASGESVLGSTFSITDTAGVYQDTGLYVDLPAAGTYLVIADVRAMLDGNAGTIWWLHGKFYNSTDSADVANSDRLLAYSNNAATIDQKTTAISKIIPVAAAKRIKLYVARNGVSSPSWTTSQILSDTNGRTIMSYHALTT